MSQKKKTNNLAKVTDITKKDQSTDKRKLHPFKRNGVSKNQSQSESNKPKRFHRPLHQRLPKLSSNVKIPSNQKPETKISSTDTTKPVRRRNKYSNIKSSGYGKNPPRNAIYSDKTSKTTGTYYNIKSSGNGKNLSPNTIYSDQTSKTIGTSSYISSKSSLPTVEHRNEIKPTKSITGMSHTKRRTTKRESTQQNLPTVLPVNC